MSGMSQARPAARAASVSGVPGTNTRPPAAGAVRSVSNTTRMIYYFRNNSGEVTAMKKAITIITAAVLLFANQAVAVCPSAEELSQDAQWQAAGKPSLINPFRSAECFGGGGWMPYAIPSLPSPRRGGTSIFLQPSGPGGPVYGYGPNGSSTIIWPMAGGGFMVTGD